MKAFVLLLISAAAFYYSFAKKELVDRPEFRVVHNGIQPVSCDVYYKEGREVVYQENMMLHDYFKHDDGNFYFAVSAKDRKFLLSAKHIVKDKCSKEAMQIMYSFVKVCKNINKPRTVKPANSMTLTEKEKAHIKNSVKTVNVRADIFKQQGRLLDVYDIVTKTNPYKRYNKLLKTYYLIEGNVPDHYGHTTLTLYTSRSVSRNGGETAYCLDYQTAYYHATCEYFERVKKIKYTGPRNID